MRKMYVNLHFIIIFTNNFHLLEKLNHILIIVIIALFRKD